MAFIKSHTLMEYTVDSLDGVPVYYTKHDLAAARLAVTHTARYTLLIIGSSQFTMGFYAPAPGGILEQRDPSLCLSRGAAA